MNELRLRIGGQRRVAPAPSRLSLSALSRSVIELPWQLFEGKRRWVAAGFVGVSALSGVAAVAVVNPAEPSAMQTAVVEKLAVFPEELPLPSLPFIYEDRVAPGDTTQTIFQRLGISDPQALAFLQENPESAQALRQLRSGFPVSAVVDVTGRLLSIRLPLSADGSTVEISRKTLNQTFQVSSSFQATLERGTEMRNGVIRNSLFAATEAADVPDSVATQLATLFDSEIDFHTGLRQGDTFSVIYETFYDRGATARAGRILAAEFVNQGKRHSVFLHSSADGRSEYYTSDGRSLRSAFLSSPVEFSRVTSSFGRRLHPILRNWHTHSGVDFGAPTGTPVRATADGVVDFAGWNGGYGKFVVIKHRDNISTAYAHLSAIANDLRPGTIVEQGDTIGQVGMTGRSTAPHLHYEFRINDIAQNPMTATVPLATPLAGEELMRFRENTRLMLARLAMLNRNIAFSGGNSGTGNL